MPGTINHPTPANLETVFETQALLGSNVAGLDRADAGQPELDAARFARMAESRLEGLCASLDAET